MSAPRSVDDVVRVLVLGGTSEASTLARAVEGDANVDITISLAGRTANPVPLPGRVRIGGFGGPDGLACYLRDEAVDAVIDATHPFARHMRWNVAQACTATGVSWLRVERPPWIARDGDTWQHVASSAEAAHAIAEGSVPGPASRVFLSIGRQLLSDFIPAADGDRWFLIRAIDAPDPQPLQPAAVVLAKGPFALDDERALLTAHGIDLLVTKNSGGDAAAPKLTAARALGIPVLVIDRPPSP
ncbi:MAG: cobalt-precorrin-6A reductase, partial [Acidimicrobiales bacterium]